MGNRIGIVVAKLASALCFIALTSSFVLALPVPPLQSPWMNEPPMPPAMPTAWILPPHPPIAVLATPYPVQAAFIQHVAPPTATPLPTPGEPPPLPDGELYPAWFVQMQLLMRP